MQEHRRSIKVYVLLVGIGLALGIVCCEEDKDPGVIVYFKVAEINVEHGDSYILPLSNEEAIAHARALIHNPEQDGRLVVAKVTAATGSEPFKNIDLNTNQVWSWKVSEFIEFADFTAEILDGGPSDVEDMDFWFPNTNNGSTTEGVIGFWNYTVVAEVDEEELD